MLHFIYTGLPARVVFGAGTVADVPEEAARLGIARALVVTTPAQAKAGQALVDRLGPRAAGLFAQARMHTPVEVTRDALARFRDLDADGVVALGGGSTIGLGKAIALRTDAPQIVLPTTYAGSEMTPIIGETRDGEKVTQRSLKVLPETVIYDVDFTLGLPARMTVTSGMNAIAHAVEALYAGAVNPVLSMMAEEGVARLVSALPTVLAAPADAAARSDALMGAWLCAVCLGSGGIALHHKLCHVLGGSFDLPHAETHTAILPHALAYNAPAIPDAMERLRRATGSADPARALHALARRGGAPMALGELGMPRDGIARAVDIALKNPYANPRPVTRDGLTALLETAWAGHQPER